MLGTSLAVYTEINQGVVDGLCIPGRAINLRNSALDVSMGIPQPLYHIASKFLKKGHFTSAFQRAISLIALAVLNVEQNCVPNIFNKFVYIWKIANAKKKKQYDSSPVHPLITDSISLNEFYSCLFHYVFWPTRAFFFVASSPKHVVHTRSPVCQFLFSLFVIILCLAGDVVKWSVTVLLCLNLCRVFFSWKTSSSMTL